MSKYMQSNAVFTIIIIHVVIMFFLSLEPSLQSYLYMPATVNEFLLKPWTLITAIFIHENIWHMMIKLFLFWIFGTLLEKATSSTRLVFIYLTTGALGAFSTLLYASIVNQHVFFAAACSSICGIVAHVCAINPDIKIMNIKAFDWMIGLFLMISFASIISLETSLVIASHIVGLLFGYMSGMFKVATS